MHPQPHHPNLWAFFVFALTVTVLSFALGGPFGGLVGGGVVLVTLGLVFYTTSGETTALAGSNCPECGARNDPDAERCTHCESSL
jgi:hypothetical protein